MRLCPIVPGRRAARQLSKTPATAHKKRRGGSPRLTGQSQERGGLGADRLVTEDPHAAVWLLPVAMGNQPRGARHLVLLATDVGRLR